MVECISPTSSAPSIHAQKCIGLRKSHLSRNTLYGHYNIYEFQDVYRDDIYSLFSMVEETVQHYNAKYVDKQKLFKSLLLYVYTTADTRRLSV